MADEQAKEKKGKDGKLVPGPRPGAPVRYFEGAHIEYVRMGRTMGIFRGSYGTYDVARGTIDLVGGQMYIGEARMTADRVNISLGPNKLTTSGKVRLEEGGVTLEADRLVATPVLWGMKTNGNVRLHSSTREAAETLMKSHKG